MFCYWQFVTYSQLNLFCSSLQPLLRLLLNAFIISDSTIVVDKRFQSFTIRFENLCCPKLVAEWLFESLYLCRGYCLMTVSHSPIWSTRNLPLSWITVTYRPFLSCSTKVVDQEFEVCFHMSNLSILAAFSLLGVVRSK